MQTLFCYEQIFKTKISNFQIFATKKLSRNFRDQGGDGVTSKTKAELMKISRIKLRRRYQEAVSRDLHDRGGYGGSLANRAEMYPPRSPKSQEIFLDRAVFPFSGKSRRIYLGRKGCEELFIGRAVSLLGLQTYPVSALT